MKEDISQLNHIIGPMSRDDEIYMHNEGRLWSTWDHYTTICTEFSEALSEAVVNSS